MSRDFILQRITISISTLSKCVREKKQKTSFVPGGTATRYKCPPATSEWGRHICIGPRLHPVQMLARYKYSTFVPDGLYRFNTQYK
jgi:hypothetical protein